MWTSVTILKATRAACRYLKEDANAKYKNWVAVAASYNTSRHALPANWPNRMWTTRWLQLVLAAKQLFNAPTTFGFRLRASDLYPPIPYTEITVTKGIADLARFARSKGINLAILKNMNPLVAGNILVQP